MLDMFHVILYVFFYLLLLYWLFSLQITLKTSTSSHWLCDFVSFLCVCTSTSDLVNTVTCLESTSAGH